MKVYKIHFIRHGITQGNIESRYMGSTDIDLCQQGIDEIKSLVDTYEYPNVGKVYVSPLKRCKQTAKIIYPFMEQTVIEGLREYSFGDFEGRSVEELSKDPVYEQWRSSKFSMAIPNAEDTASFNQRIMDSLHFIIEDIIKNDLTHVAVVTHGGVIMNILSSIGVPKLQDMFGIGNGKGYTLILDRAMWDNFGVMEVFEPLPLGADPSVTVGKSLFESLSE